MLLGCSARVPQPLIKTEIKYVEVPVIVEPPHELTKPCKAPSWGTDEITYSDVITYLVETLGVLGRCNKQLGTIRDISRGDLSKER